MLLGETYAKVKVKVKVKVSSLVLLGEIGAHRSYCHGPQPTDMRDHREVTLREVITIGIMSCCLIFLHLYDKNCMYIYQKIVLYIHGEQTSNCFFGLCFKTSSPMDDNVTSCR